MGRPPKSRKEPDVIDTNASKLILPADIESPNTGYELANPNSFLHPIPQPTMSSAKDHLFYSSLYGRDVDVMKKVMVNPPSKGLSIPNSLNENRFPLCSPPKCEQSFYNNVPSTLHHPPHGDHFSPYPCSTVGHHSLKQSPLSNEPIKKVPPTPDLVLHGDPMKQKTFLSYASNPLIYEPRSYISGASANPDNMFDTKDLYGNDKNIRYNLTHFGGTGDRDFSCTNYDKHLKDSDIEPHGGGVKDRNFKNGSPVYGGGMEIDKTERDSVSSVNEQDDPSAE